MRDLPPERQLVMDYLASFGLDGREIAADFTDEGFWLVRNKRTLHPWPDGLNVEWLRAAVRVANAADFRRAGMRHPVVQ